MLAFFRAWRTSSFFPQGIGRADQKLSQFQIGASHPNGLSTRCSENIRRIWIQHHTLKLWYLRQFSDKTGKIFFFIIFISQSKNLLFQDANHTILRCIKTLMNVSSWCPDENKAFDRWRQTLSCSKKHKPILRNFINGFSKWWRTSPFFPQGIG